MAARRRRPVWQDWPLPAEISAPQEGEGELDELVAEFLAVEVRRALQHGAADGTGDGAGQHVGPGVAERPHVRPAVMSGRLGDRAADRVDGLADARHQIAL